MYACIVYLKIHCQIISRSASLTRTPTPNLQLPGAAILAEHESKVLFALPRQTFQCRGRSCAKWKYLRFIRVRIYLKQPGYKWNVASRTLQQLLNSLRLRNRTTNCVPNVHQQLRHSHCIKFWSRILPLSGRDGIEGRSDRIGENHGLGHYFPTSVTEESMRWDASRSVAYCPYHHKLETNLRIARAEALRGIRNCIVLCLICIY